MQGKPNQDVTCSESREPAKVINTTTDALGAAVFSQQRSSKMYIVIELINGHVRRFRNLTEQQIQALTDCEDYLIIKIETADFRTAISASLFDDQFNEETILEGKITQDGSVVQVQ